MANNTKKKLPLLTRVLALIAVALLVTGTVGGILAKLTIFSQEYDAQMDMKHIGIQLNESNEANGANPAKISEKTYKVTSGYDGEWVMDEGELVQNLLSAQIEADKDDTYVHIGQPYNEYLSVTNTGAIDEYVRVTVYKYWIKDGVKDTSLDPALIDLHFLDGGKWIINEDESTTERTVLYYTDVVPVGGVTAPLTDTLKITYPTVNKTSQTTKVVDGNVTVYTTTFVYDSVEFVIEAQADGVQTHNAQDAIKSAWGKNVTMTGTSLDPASLSHN